MSTNDIIYDALTRHQVFLQRYAKGREREASLFVRNVLESSIRLLDLDLTDIPISSMDRLTQDLMDVGVSRYGNYSDSFIEEMTEFVEYEVDFNYRLLQDNVRANIRRPTTAQAVGTTLTKIMQLEPRKGYTNRDSLRTFGYRKSYQIAQIVRDGYLFGDSTDQVTERIMALTGTQQRQASTLARTITNHVAISARNMVITAAQLSPSSLMGSMTWGLIRPPDGLLTAREGERRSETLLPTRNGLDGNLWRFRRRH